MDPQAQKTVLIAEDEPFLHKMLVQTFELAGFKVLPAMDGEVALNYALTQHPDISILDILMPKLDGVRVLQRMRQDLWGRNALIIMLTNLTADDQITKAMAATPPSYYFVKSNMEPDQLLGKVTEMLAQTPAA